MSVEITWFIIFLFYVCVIAMGYGVVRLSPDNTKKDRKIGAIVLLIGVIVFSVLVLIVRLILR